MSAEVIASANKATEDEGFFKAILHWLFGGGHNVVMHLFGTVGLIIGAGLSLHWAYQLHGLGKAKWTSSDQIWAGAMVGFWILVPPVMLLFDWSFFCRGTQDEMDNHKHTHELARNVWIAFAILMIALLGFDLSP